MNKHKSSRWKYKEKWLQSNIITKSKYYLLLVDAVGTVFSFYLFMCDLQN